MIDRIGQALQTVGSIGIFACLIVGSILALIVILARR